MGLPEIEQVLEDKYQAMKHAKGWEEEEDDYALFLQVPPTRKSPRKHSKDIVDTVGNLDVKQPIVQTRKATKSKGQKAKTQQKKKEYGKGDSKGKGHLDMSKIKCFNCGEYGHFARDCPKACDNANIAQESEQKGKLESMIWTVLVYAKSVGWFVQNYNMKMRMKTK